MLRLAAAKRCASAVGDFGVEDQLAVERLGHGLAGDVVFGGSEAAGEDHDGGAARSWRDGVGQAVAIVADDALGDHFDAQVVQLAR